MQRKMRCSHGTQHSSPRRLYNRTTHAEPLYAPATPQTPPSTERPSTGGIPARSSTVKTNADDTPFTFTKSRGNEHRKMQEVLAFFVRLARLGCCCLATNWIALHLQWLKIPLITACEFARRALLFAFAARGVVGGVQSFSERCAHDSTD
jgi:hypothetical protein